MKNEKTKLKIAKIFILLGFILIFVYLVFDLENDFVEKNNINTFLNAKESIPFEIDKNDFIEANNSKYIAVLEIPKIKLKKGLYSYESSSNNVDENITILRPSVMPNVENSVLILASHSGNSRVSYFECLENLSSNDLVIIYYNGTKYYYKITDFYTEKKKGYISIPEFEKGKYIILTTCKDSLNQLIYIGKLVNEA